MTYFGAFGTFFTNIKALARFFNASTWPVALGCKISWDFKRAGLFFGWLEGCLDKGERFLLAFCFF
ncbi:uncharacterized protein METZ01_LOCUS234484 [marine metagenome]|uniref:Uncharacterized protein n=1 Tax=marine metagenome TaxID=408172 RepID=A0A382H2Y9_9ZZZZ